MIFVLYTALPARLGRRLDVLIMPEQIGGIIFGFDFRQSPVIGGKFSHGQFAIAIRAEIVDLYPSGRVRLRGIPQVASPFEVYLRLSFICPD